VPRLTETEARAALAEAYHRTPSYIPYRHYKGGHAYVLCCSLAEATHEPLVTYCEVGSAVTWTRPQAEFLGPVEVDGRAVPRFRREEGP
jgi:hypothetical protein